MKKTLFLSALCIALCGQAFAGENVKAADVTIGASEAFTPLDSSSYAYDNLTIGAAGIYKHIVSGGMFELYANGLSGSGNVTLDRTHNGGNFTVLWLEGDCSEYSGSFTLKAENENKHNVRIGLGGTAASAGAVDLTSATFDMSKGDLHLRQDASIGTLSLNGTTVSSVSLTSLPVPVSASAVSTSDRSSYGNITSIATSEAARTLTVRNLTMTGSSTIASGVTLALTGSGTIDAGNTLTGKLSVQKGATLNCRLSSVDITSETAYSGPGNGFGSVTYSKDFGSNLVLADGVTTQINGKAATATNGVVSGTYESKYYINATETELNEAVLAQADSMKFNVSSAVTVTSGMFDYSLVESTDRSKVTSLTLNGGNATMGGNRVYDGNITIGGGSTLEMTTNDVLKYTGTAESKTLTINGTLAMGANRLSIGNEGNGGAKSLYKLVMNGGTVTGAGDGEGALDFFNTSSLTVTGNSLINAPIRVRNNKTLQIEVTGTTDSLTISGTMMEQNTNYKGAIAKNGAGTMTLSAENSMTGGLTVNKGTLVVKHDSALGKGSVSVASGATLEIASGITATGFSSMSFAEGANAVINGTLTLGNNAVTLQSLTLGTNGLLELNEHNGKLTTSALTVAGGNATLNANLVVTDNGTMDFSNHTELTMGCTVTIGDHVTIMIDDSELDSIVNTGSVMTIINDVEGVDMNNLAPTLGSGWKFVDAQGNSLDAYNLRLDVVSIGEGKVNIVVAPEPATATLSLLALAGLAARRRRK